MVKIDIFIQKRNVQKAFEFIIAPFSVRNTFYRVEPFRLWSVETSKSAILWWNVSHNLYELKVVRLLPVDLETTSGNPLFTSRHKLEYKKFFLLKRV